MRPNFRLLCLRRPGMFHDSNPQEISADNSPERTCSCWSFFDQLGYAIFPNIVQGVGGGGAQYGFLTTDSPQKKSQGALTRGQGVGDRKLHENLTLLASTPANATPGHPDEAADEDILTTSD